MGPLRSGGVLTCDGRGELSAIAPNEILIKETCDEIKQLLITKNRKYGDAALNPTRIFSRSDDIEQIKVRIDDKLNRLKNQQPDEDEDVEQDLIGYLILLRVAKKRRRATLADTQKLMSDLTSFVSVPDVHVHTNNTGVFLPELNFEEGNENTDYGPLLNKIKDILEK